MNALRIASSTSRILSPFPSGALTSWKIFPSTSKPRARRPRTSLLTAKSCNTLSQTLRIVDSMSSADAFQIASITWFNTSA